ncbi:hypothetical protein FHR33_002917 [Nonomuraea dietziae]|uniref:Uncharacterized protein n=1 Tax=Nonomuraea dietziae TaxID=65515 RepID=A0A7W5YN37_9ACTN|nr:hypothetical protein [Nonomuraea dietziae]
MATAGVDPAGLMARTLPGPFARGPAANRGG